MIESYWQSKALDLEAIDLPAFVVASWSDHGLHSRGTLEAYRRISSAEKCLLVHGQKKWRHYYDPENVELQRRFFDHFLKGDETGLDDWPPVRIQVRDRGSEGAFRDEAAWPLARTNYRPLYLDAASGSLSDAPSYEAATLAYESTSEAATFTIRFDAPVELTGYIKLRLGLAAQAADDADVFVGLDKLDAHGARVPFAFYALYDDGPLALGWLRASHRELDEARSTPWQPVHPHLREVPLEPGDPVPLDTEIWPTSVHFAAGESLRLTIQGCDIYDHDSYRLAFAKHDDLRNRGMHVLYTRGSYDSHLLVPVIPPERGAPVGP